MTRLFSLILLSGILVVSMSASPRKSYHVKNHNKKTLVDLYLNNGTAWIASANFSGSIYSEPPEDCSEVAEISTGTYNITLSTTAPGTHQYVVPGQTTQFNSTGSAYFPNVSVTADFTVAVY